MSEYPFNFTRLHPLFLEAISRHEPSIAFSLADGKGRFTFLLFLATDSKGTIKWNDLELFILLGRTQNVINIKLWGNHTKAGNFKVWLRQPDIDAIRDELGILGPNPEAVSAFFWFDFLQKLNDMFPSTLSLEDKIATIQENEARIRISCSRYIDDAKKIYLLGKRELSSGKPREETLRKLYMLKVDPRVIAKLICGLKEANWTVAWTDQPTDSDAFQKLWNIVSARKKSIE